MNDVLSLVCVWALGALTCGSILSIWFSTDWPCVMTKLAKKLGWGKDKNWPDELDLKFWIRPQWESWAVEQGGLPFWLAHMLNCPRCFSCHVSYVVAGIVALVTCNPWMFLVVGSYPWTAQKMYFNLKVTEKESARKDK